MRSDPVLKAAFSASLQNTTPDINPAPGALKSLASAVSDVLKPRQSRLDGELRQAARFGNAPRVRQLLAKGANPNAPSDTKGYTAVHEAARSNNTAVMQSILAVPGVNVNVAAKIEPQLTPLHVAAVADNANAVTQLLGAGADATATTQANTTRRQLTPKTPAALADMIHVNRGGSLGDVALPDSVRGQLSSAETLQRGEPPPDYIA
jgi:ankyrin repeat protein